MDTCSSELRSGDSWGRMIWKESKAGVGLNLAVLRNHWPSQLKRSQLGVGGNGSRGVAMSQTLWGLENYSQGCGCSSKCARENHWIDFFIRKGQFTKIPLTASLGQGH